MIDIHCHILPGVDDGSEDLETSLYMARQAADSGVTTIVATPHCNLPYAARKNYRSLELRDRFVDLCRAIKREHIPLSILPGSEIMCTPELPQLLLQDQLLGLAGSRYLLVEFFFDESPDFMEEMLSQVLLQGQIPLIAHPERYFVVQDHPDVVLPWLERGALLQVNKDSILGAFGHGPELAADWLLRHHLPIAAASDAHGIARRTTELGTLYSYLSKAYGRDYADLLLQHNPRRILENRRITLPI